MGINVTPTNFLASIASSAVGDTINFASGTYTLTTNPTGAAAVFPPGRHYIGNGSTIKLSTGVAANDQQELILVNGSSSTTEFTGFTFTNAQLHCEVGSFNVHNNTFTNGRRGIYIGGAYSSHFDQNTLSHLTGEGIFGYPGDNNTFNSNSFDYVWEPIHLIATNHQTSITGNHITHATRIGIELQNGMQNLTVSNNWMSDWLPNLDPKNGIDSHMGISCATGGKQVNGQWVFFGEHINITGNVLIQSGPSQAKDTWAKSAIEIMGDLDINITNNYAWGWGNGVLNGASVQGANVSKNIWICDNAYGGDAASWPIQPVHGSGDKSYKIGDPAAPAWPADPTKPVVTPPVVPVPSPTPPTTGNNMILTDNKNGSITLTTTALAAATSLSIYPSSLGVTQSVSLGTLPVNSTTATITGIPANWNVSVVLGASVGQIQSTGGTSTTFAPALLALVKTIKSVVVTYSDGTSTSL